MQQLSPSAPALAAKSGGSTQIYRRWLGKRGLSSAFGGEASPPQLLEVEMSSLVFGQGQEKGKGLHETPPSPCQLSPMMARAVALLS